jgi:hypothetical protein
MGWILVLDGVFAWLANPPLIFAWRWMWMDRSPFRALACSMVSLIFSLSFLLHQEILTSELGVHSKITGYGWGYWLWNASIVTALVGCISAAIADPFVLPDWDDFDPFSQDSPRSM